MHARTCAAHKQTLRFKHIDAIFLFWASTVMSFRALSISYLVRKHGLSVLKVGWCLMLLC